MMTVRLVATVGDPVLRQPGGRVDPARLEEPPTQALIDDMIETMRYYQGAGLAAPQVMAPARIAVIEVKANRRYPYKPDIPLTVLVNPEIEWKGGEEEIMEEGCLSLPAVLVDVERPIHVRVRARDDAVARLVGRSADGVRHRDARRRRAAREPAAARSLRR